VVYSQKNSHNFKWSQDTLVVLEICHDTFKQAEVVYQYLVNAHTDNSEVSRMWGLLAIDKCNHADTFKMAQRLKGQGIRKIHDSEETARSIFAKMKSIPMGKGDILPTVESALRFSLKMEELLSKIHFLQVVEFNNQQDARLLTSSLRSSSSIQHMLTEEYVNLTMMESDFFE
jgi:rubrerythrin